MTKATILFADNDADFLKIRKKLLEYQGYEVIPATNPLEAKRILEQEQVDLAILDIRMRDDNDSKDISGLDLAKETARSVPKLIMTRFPSYEYVREALEPDLEDLPPAVDFIAKQEGLEALTEAIRRILKFETKQYQETIDRTSEKLRKDYDEARREAMVNYRTSLGIAAAGILILFTGIGLAVLGTSVTALISVIGGVLAEIVSILFFKRADVINRGSETLYAELLQFRQLETLLASCGGRLSQEEREECQRQVREIIGQAIRQWPLGRPDLTDESTS